MKKFLSYVLTFIIMFMLSATGTIWLAKTANNRNNNNFVPGENNQGGAEQTSFFSGILSTFNENQQFNVSGDVAIAYEDKQLDLNLFASIDIQDKTNIKVDAIIKTEIEGRTFAVSAIFYDNTIYITFNDVSVKAKIDNIKDLATLAKKLIPAGSGIGDIDLAAKMEKMLPEIMGSLNNPQTSTLANGDIKNVIDMKDLAVASIVTTSKGLLKSAEVETYDLYGIKAKISANIEFDKSIAIENPETRLVSRDYLDLKRAMSIVSNMKTWENFKTNVDMKVESGIGNYNFRFNVVANTKEKAFMLNMNSCSEASLEGLKIKFVDGNLFVCLGDIKILVSDELLNVLGENVKDAISKLVGETGNLALNKETLTKVLDKVKTIDISNVFETLDKIKKLQVENDQIVFEMDGGFVTVNLSDNKVENIVSEIVVNGNKISFTMNAENTNEKVENENKEEFFDVYKIYQKNIEFYQSSAFDINANLELLKNGERFVSLNGNVSFDFEKPYLNTELLVDIGKELNVNVVYENDIAYVQICDVFVKMSKADFENLLDELNLNDSFSETKNQKTEEIKTKLKDKLDNIKFEDIKDKLESIKSLKVNSAGIEISVDLSAFGFEGTGHFVLDTENYVIKTVAFENFGFGEYLVNGDVKVEGNSITVKEFDKSKYLDVYSFAKNVISLQNLNNAKLGFNFKVNLEGNDVNLVGNAGFDRNQKYGFANGRVDVNGNRYNVDVQAFENDIYAKIEDIAVKINLPWIVEIVKQFTANIDTKEVLNSTLEKLKSYLPENMKDLDLGLLGSIKGFKINSNGIFVDFDATTLGLNSDVSVRIEIRNNQISALEMLDFRTKEGNEISFKIDVYYVSVRKANIEKEQYLDVEKTIDNLIALKDMRHASLTAKANVVYKDINVLADINGAFDLDNNYYFAAGNVNYNGTAYDLDFRIYENNIFAVLNDIKAKTSIDFVKELVSKFGLELNTDELVSKVKDEISSKTGEMKFEFNVSMLEKVKTLVINANTIKVVLDKDLFNLGSDVDVTIVLQDGNISRLVLANLEINNETQIELDLTLDLANVQINRANESEYLDVEEFVSNIMALADRENFNAKVVAALYEKNGSNFEKLYDFDINLNKQFENGNNALNALLNVVYGGKNVTLEAILQNNKLYASFNNFKVKIAFESVLDTVHKVLETFGKDPFAYDDIINKVINILSGSSIKETLKDLDINLDMNASDFDISEVLRSIKKVVVNANKIAVEIDGSLFGSEGTISLEIELENNNISKIKTNKISIDNYAVDLVVELNTDKTTLKTVSESEEKEYIILDKFADVAIATYETLKNKVISGTMHIDFIFGGEHNIVLAEYGIKYDSDKNRLSGYIKASFNGVTLNVYYVDSVFYVDLGGVNNNAENRLQIKAEFTELNDVLAYIKEKTGAEIDIDFNEIRDILAGVKDIELNFEDVRDILFGKDLGFVKEAIFGDGTFEVNINNSLTIFVNFKQTVSSVIFRTNVVEAEIYCESFNDFAFDTLNKDTYNSYTVITNAVDSVLNTIKTQPLEFFANLLVYKNSALNFSVDAGYQDEILFMNIKGLKIRVQRQKLAEILSYALQSMGIDPSIISFIGNVSDAKDLDTSNLQELIPDLDLGNPFSMLKYLKGIVLKDGVFEIDIDSKLLGNSNKADMKISLKTDNNWISSLKVSNVFVKQDTSLDISVVFDRKVQEDYGNYIDISNSADLVRAFVNTSALNEYRITGKVKLGVGNTDLKNVYVNVDARVILDENKNPIVQVDISNYPLIGLVNGKNSNGVGGVTASTQRARTMSIYYKDGEMLLKTSDEKWGLYKKLDRVTKITPSYLMSNLKYYMQWLLGFEDYIQEKINSAIDTSNANKQQASDNGELDLSNIIKKYEKQGNTHYLDINIGKIAYNDDIGTLSIKLTTVNNAKTGNKDYIGYLDINLDMLDNMISLKTDDNNKLQLENIVGSDSTVSVSTAESELKDGTFKLDGEYERTNNGSFSQTNRNSVTITLDNNGGSGTTSISGSVGYGLSLPTPTKVVDNGITRETYEFLGYYDVKGNKFTRNCFPRESTTLYAKWELEKVQEYRTLTLEKNNGEANQEISKLQFSQIKVDALANYSFDNGIYHTDFTFVGWMLNGELVGKEVTITLENNITLVAVWSENTRYYRTVTFDTNGKGSNFENRVLEGETISLSNLENVFEATEETKTTFGFAGWLIGETKVATLTVSEDVTLLASWKELSVVFNRTLTFMHGSTLVASVKIFAGDNIAIPTNALLKSDTKFYLESGFKTEYTLAAMPDNDLVVYIRNKFTISFNANGGNGVSSITAYEGEKVSLGGTSKGKTGSYTGNYHIGKGYEWNVTSYTFSYWSLNGVKFDGVMTDHDITLDANYSESVENKIVTYYIHKRYQKDNFD